MSILKKIDRRFANYKASRRPLDLRGHVDLPDDFFFSAENSRGQGHVIDSNYFSFVEVCNLKSLPSAITRVAIEYWRDIEFSMSGTSVMRSAIKYRNVHIPVELRKNGEIFSEAWHLDTIGVPNLQIFVLLHHTDVSNGPLRYVSSKNMRKYKGLLKKISEPNARSTLNEVPEELVSYFTGDRGDFLILNTDGNLHSATIPKKDSHRDMFSMCFEPQRLTSHDPENVLSYEKALEIT